MLGPRVGLAALVNASNCRSFAPAASHYLLFELVE